MKCMVKDKTKKDKQGEGSGESIEEFTKKFIAKNRKLLEELAKH